mmetsp:Transcript_93298/g.266890  ORF Transcript_93298/g.266890 Transcript_93298/m.266890 type:complete len:230 (+) Transcript_93298:459-1148(+)
MVGLLLFFLIPRQPSVNYQYMVYSGPVYNGQGSLSNVTASDFVGRYRFENMNYYSVDWSGLAMKNYYMSTATTDCDITKVHWNTAYCGKEMGSYEKKPTFSTGPRTRSYQNVPLTADAGSGTFALNVGEMLTECFLYGQVLVMSQGHISETTGLHDFGKVSAAGHARGRADSPGAEKDARKHGRRTRTHAHTRARTPANRCRSTTSTTGSYATRPHYHSGGTSGGGLVT